MDYKAIIKSARDAGYSSEQTMWKSIDNVNDLLESIKDSHPGEYWRFLRSQYGLMFGGHYGCDFAMYDVDNMMHIEDGNKISGPYWSKGQTDEIYSAYKPMIPQPYNDWDVYVALNAQYHDYVEGLKKRHPDTFEHDLIDEAIDFWFNDDDWPDNTKVWSYMCMRSKSE